MGILAAILAVLIGVGVFAIDNSWAALPRGKKTLVGFGVSVVIIALCFMLIDPSKLSPQPSSQESVQARLEEKGKRLQRTTQIAKELRNSLRSAGINESLVTDIEVDADQDRIIVIVTNVWLSRPDYEQTQMRQTLELLVKKIAPPNGHPFWIMDYMGNIL